MRLKHLIIVIIVIIVLADPALAILPGNNHVFYQVFVRSFYDSNGDGIGDLQGLIKKLDYLNDGLAGKGKDLEVTGLYLMPIFAATSYHGYDITSYYQINPDYGTIDDLHQLITEAHQRGIKVIIDLPINHTSLEHSWFKKALQGDIKYSEYYVWADEQTEINKIRDGVTALWHQVGNNHYYAYFGEGMPDLNYNNPEVQQEMVTIGKYWLKQGVDGFRIDAARHIYPVAEYQKNYSWWSRFKAEMKKVKSDVYLVGEVWDNPNIIAPFYNYGFDSCFNFYTASLIIDKLRSGFSYGFNDTMTTIYNTYDQTADRYIDAPFLSNHDQNRVMSELGDDKKAKLAAAILLTLPGNPFIYYGEEIGMEGSKPDEMIRQPMQWYEGEGKGETTWQAAVTNEGIVAVDQANKDPDSLLNHYRKLIRVRNHYPVLDNGGIIFLDAGSEMIAYIRYYDNKKVYIYHNIGIDEKEIKFSKSFDLKVVFASLEGIITPPFIEEEEVVFNVPALSTMIFEELVP